MQQRIYALTRSPHFWLAALLLWTLFSAARSYGTSWASAALTEALRWGAGIILALTLAGLGRKTALAGPILVGSTGAMALCGLLGGTGDAHSGLTGPYHDHQLYGSALLLLLPFSAVQALASKTPLRRGLALAAFAAGTLCLLLSETRSAWIGLAVSCLVFGTFWLSRSDARPRRLRVALVPLALLLTGLAGLWAVSGPAEQQAAVSARAATLTTLAQDGSWQSRLDTWRGAARSVARRPLLGFGLGRYPGESWRWTAGGGPLAPAERPSLTNEAHSLYLQTAAETGLLGLGLYLAALTAFFVAGLRRLRSNRRFGGSSRLLLAAACALAGQCVDALASPSWQFPEVSLLFWAVLGLGLASLRRDAPEGVPAALPLFARRTGQVALSGCLAVVLAAQILPVGLLPPVEAYVAPTGSTLTSISLSRVSPAGAAKTGTIIQFSCIATYTYPDGSTTTHDISGDSLVWFASVNTPAAGYGSASFPNCAFTVPNHPYTAASALSGYVLYADPTTKVSKQSQTVTTMLQN